LSPIQKNLISIARNHCRFTVLFAMPMAVVLSQCTDVFGWDGQGWSKFAENYTILAIMEESAQLCFRC
jgi:hypothetical protein